MEGAGASFAQCRILTEQQQCIVEKLAPGSSVNCANLKETHPVAYALHENECEAQFCVRRCKDKCAKVFFGYFSFILIESNGKLMSVFATGCK